MLPPKMGDGHEGSKAGALKAAGASAASATTARQIGRWTLDLGAAANFWPLKVLHETVRAPTTAKDAI